MSDKEKPIFGLNKLPDKAYIKALKGRISELVVYKGKDTSYIHELEDELKTIKQKIDNSDSSSLKKEKLYNEQKTTISKLTRENQRLQKNNKELVNRIINLKKQIDEKT